MSQYGKTDYWEDRYTKYLIHHSGTPNHSIGTSVLVVLKTSLPPTSINLIRSLTSDQEILDLVKRCMKKDMLILPISISPMSVSKP